MERRLTGLPRRTRLTRPIGLPGLTKRSGLTGRTDRANRTGRTDRPDRTNRASFLEVAVEPNLEFKKKLSRVCGEMHFFFVCRFCCWPYMDKPSKTHGFLTIRLACQKKCASLCDEMLNKNGNQFLNGRVGKVSGAKHQKTNVFFKFFYEKYRNSLPKHLRSCQMRLPTKT